jgi:hypothetical protein
MAHWSAPVKSGKPLLMYYPVAKLQSDATWQQKFIQCLLLRQAFRAVTATPMEISTT